LEAVHSGAAGIDIGNSMHYVAVPPDRDSEPVRQFGCFTEDLRRMAAWLKQCGITTVALQSTGVYWIPVYDVLEAEALEVCLVNAQHTKNLPGRKSDVQESQWLMKLHTYGLLRNSFRPASTIRTLRCYWRQRGEHIQAASTCIKRMQKALTGMNRQLHNVISDLSGLTGMRILRAIVKGERDGRQLAALRHYRIEASEEDIAKSLQGNWREELLFVLRQELDSYDVSQRKIAECDAQVEKHLAVCATRARQACQGPPPDPTRKKACRVRGNAPQFDRRSELERIAGVDLTRIDGVDVMTAQTVISEVGLDMSRWQNGGSLCVLAGAVSGERSQRRQGIEAGNQEGSESGRDRAADGGIDTHQKPKQPGGAIPPPPNAVGRPQGDHCHGSQTRPAHLPHAQVRPGVRREGHDCIRSQTSRKPDPLPAQKGQSARVPTH
jgi:hypothetical protein